MADAQRGCPPHVLISHSHPPHPILAWLLLCSCLCCLVRGFHARVDWFECAVSGPSHVHITRYTERMDGLLRRLVRERREGEIYFRMKSIKKREKSHSRVGHSLHRIVVSLSVLFRLADLESDSERRGEKSIIHTID